MKHTQEEIDRYKDKPYMVPADISPEDTMYYIITGLEKEKVELLYACKKAKVFIEYAKYELSDGLATLGSQFPHKEDADNELTRLEQAIAKAEGGE